MGSILESAQLRVLKPSWLTGKMSTGLKVFPEPQTLRRQDPFASRGLGDMVASLQTCFYASFKRSTQQQMLFKVRSSSLRGSQAQTPRVDGAWRSRDGTLGLEARNPKPTSPRPKPYHRDTPLIQMTLHHGSGIAKAAVLLHLRCKALNSTQRY